MLNFPAILLLSPIGDRQVGRMKESQDFGTLSIRTFFTQSLQDASQYCGLLHGAFPCISITPLWPITVMPLWPMIWSNTIGFVQCSATFQAYPRLGYDQVTTPRWGNASSPEVAGPPMSICPTSWGRPQMRAAEELRLQRLEIESPLCWMFHPGDSWNWVSYSISQFRQYYM